MTQGNAPNYWHKAARLLRSRLREAEEAESDLSTEVLALGAKAAHMSILAQDQREHISIIECKLQQALEENAKLRSGLQQTADAFFAAFKTAQQAMPADCSDLFGRDMAPHINLMGGLHRDPDYLTANGKNTIRHIDLRERKPRARKAAQ
jgi:hypothetical protein